ALSCTRPCAGGGGLRPAPGPARAAPEGLTPLDSLLSPAGGMGAFVFATAQWPARQKDGGLAVLRFCFIVSF
ncbi:hypothetical protein D3Z48_18705, partial [Clostridiaceae bacterium]|nr:hypothetical protein [Clostridiaceae bacterium]